MATELDNGRPNIRIEIKNIEAEPMDIDQNDKSEEEGEIRDNSSHRHTFSNNKETDSINTKNPLDIFLNEVDQKKLAERAKRFALKPEDIKTFTEQDLHNLYVSLGITVDNADQVRYEAIHLRSSNEINFENVVSYFMDYAPTSIEWVDDESCNIIWEDKLSTARALFHISQVVKGMPVRVASEHIIDSFILEESDLAKDVTLMNENRQIELRDESTEEFNKLCVENSVDISVINIPIPPGYWRLGRKSINSYSVLLRFSMKIDKKPYRTEKCSNFYKNVSSNKNLDHKYRGIFSRNKDINREVSDKNPWGILAKNWDEDLMFRERERFSQVEQVEQILPNPVPENPELRVRLAAKRRLGKKPALEELKSSSISEKEPSEESEEENERKSLKMPRMRMYADEEEEKIKRKKLLQALKKQTEKLKKTEIPNSDLRNILRITSKKPKNIEHDEDLDLSVSLKNRSRKLVFTVAQETGHPRTEKHQSRSLSSKSKRVRPVSPVDRKPISPIRFKRDVSSEKYKDWSNKEIYSERERRRSPKRHRERRRSLTRYSGRMYSSRGNSEERYHVLKPKSKVALVIKTQKKPSVASAIQSRRRKFETSSSSEEDSSSEESDSDSSNDDSEESSSSSTDSDSNGRQRHRMQTKRISNVPLKVEIKNDQYRRK
ncbi:hypothetical protein HHI36_007178 [Cryptolaemus montrouzieri]|uniref:Nuclear cap-binding protein subunit 3 n=1 Tax=Cryptolaemus montrouzieri TaxID=559131 RepID=A0ABD2MNY3_9CUCU